MRKQARQLENEIDVKLVAFSKIGAGSSSSVINHSLNADTSPLLGEHLFETLSEEVAQKLDKVYKNPQYKTPKLKFYCKYFT